MAETTKTPIKPCNDPDNKTTNEQKKPEEKPRVHGKPEFEKLEAQKPEPAPSKD